MTWGLLAEAITAERPAPARTRDLAQIVDQHIAWQETGFGPRRGMELPALFAVVRLIASTIDQLDLAVAGGPVPRWLRQPRYAYGDLDQGDLIQHTVTSMALNGSAYLLASTNERGWRLDAVHHDSVGVQASSFGTVALRFTYNGEPIQRLPYSGWGDGTYLIHVPYLVTPDHPEGTSPVREGWRSIGGYLDVERQAAQLIDGGTYNGGMLTTEQDITADTAERFAQRWAEHRRKGTLPVLGAGLRYETSAINPSDAQWLESRLANAQAVASMFGVPPDMLGMTMAGGGSSLSYSNAQDNNRRFRLNCLEAFTSQIEDALSPLLRSPGRNPEEEQRIVFDYTRWEEGASGEAPNDQA